MLDASKDFKRNIVPRYVMLRQNFLSFPMVCWWPKEQLYENNRL